MAGSTSLEHGTLFADRYLIQAALGEGAMGMVYRALDRSVGEVVALKILLPLDIDGDGRVDEPEMAESIARFRQEVRLARRITHRNVVRIYDLGELGTTYFLTMEYLEGETLRTLLQRERPLAPGRAAALALQICEGLTAIHATGVVHRDLKPSNVIVETGGRVAVADFGVARPVTGRQAFKTENRAGTPAFMAPEQITGGVIDLRTDLYALGLVMYVMLVGELPFPAAGGPIDAWARVDLDAPDPRERVPMPQSLAELVMNCLAREPGARPRSAAEVADRLRLVAGLDADAAPPTLSGGLAFQGETVVEGPATAEKPALFAPLLEGGAALAVLPFSYRGPPEDEYLGDALADVLVEVLAMTGGIRAISSSATARYRNERDPRTIGTALGVHAIVDGSVVLRGEDLRVSARLVAAPEGFQLWSGRFEGKLGEVLGLEERLGKRIAEALRVELTTLEHRVHATPEAIEPYLRGRVKLRAADLLGEEGAIALFERCLALAPAFEPALAAHAQASLHAWFQMPKTAARGWREQCRDRVDKALREAPDLPESHLAAGMLAAHVGDMVEAGRQLLEALRIAPTFSDAQAFLGRVQCEAGRQEEGLRRLTLARELDPTIADTLMDMARTWALVGMWPRAEEALRELEQLRSPRYMPLVLVQARLASWRGDAAAIRAALATARASSSPLIDYFENYVNVLLGDLSPEDAERTFTALHGEAQSPRLVSLSRQLMAEAYALHGHADLALQHVTQAARSVLVDVLWLDRCPVLAGLRKRPEMAEARRLVARRADAIRRVS